MLIFASSFLHTLDKNHGSLTPENRLRKLIIIGDRILIKPTNPKERMASGLYLPPGVYEKEKVQQGYVMKIGPGYAIPNPVEDEPWKPEDEQVKYIPLQAREGEESKLFVFFIILIVVISIGL